ncbi:hypothetical protein J2751_002124 [Halorubrum alkaliphilum]|uniref:DUF429 domain-containing protein n=1 Tax=Halorubrum alkaliphilum TaxID=261290 RepID=A0A8T4GH88_9EURY|nr:DUF429 domain-containing protein [Halorubrum alkaliphilum]MBP1923087.1 hypothetical protein [Halorubrum alkaliphilum]
MSDAGRPVDATRVYGVDFSAAARDAGTKTWVAAGTIADGELRIESVEPLVEFADPPSAGRDDALRALAEWIRELDESTVVGLDFPFGLPRFIVEETGHDSWRSVINGFPDTLINNHAADDDVDTDGDTDGDADDDTGADGDDPVRAFAERCVELTDEHGDGTYDKRETDGAVGARSPYGFIADTISFYGMRDVLAPVVDAVRVEPMDTVANDGADATSNGIRRSRPTLVETYPAAVLDALGLCRTDYKGSSAAETTRRRRNAEGLASESDVGYKESENLVDRIVDDDGGDALDAVAACLGAYAAAADGYSVATDGVDWETVALEGYIYALRGR